LSQTQVITDAKLIEQFAKKAMEEPAVEIKTRAPSESVVKLPGGFVTEAGELITTAEVRELTGADEEAIAKAGTVGKSLNVLLQRGLIALGSEQVSKDDLDTLLSGDRDAILIGIRRVTFGNTIDVPVQCQSCRQEGTATIDLVSDVPERKLEDSVADRAWEVETTRGVVTVMLPNGIVQKKLMENMDKTSAEINTLLLSGCIVTINGAPSVGASTALSLSMADRAKIIDQILEKNPGPRLGEVTKACKACGEDMSLPLSLVDLFRL
jgi:hypothetical protein